MSIFAERLKALRDNKGNTQNELGKHIGKSREAVSKYEIGEREPDLEAVASLSKYFNVSADYILGITDENNSTIREQDLPYNDETHTFEKYLCDNSFIPIFRLAIKIKDYDLDLKAIESYVNTLIKDKTEQKHP